MAVWGGVWACVALWGVLSAAQIPDVAVAWAPASPPRGFSTWNSFQFNVSSALIRQAADALVASGLSASGYRYVLIDDGWPACSRHREDGGCAAKAPRDSRGRIAVDTGKFPGGFAPLAAYVHGKGLKLGIYTSVSYTTCGGYTGSLGHEAVDAEAFAEVRQFNLPSC